MRQLAAHVRCGDRAGLRCEATGVARSNLHRGGARRVSSPPQEKEPIAVTAGGPRDWTTTVDVVIPTTGRESLRVRLAGLAGAGAHRITVVDDRARGSRLRVPAGVELLRSGGRGPAAARNVGWRASGPSRRGAFLDDHVQGGPDWGESLAEDLESFPPPAGAS